MSFQLTKSQKRSFIKTSQIGNASKNTLTHAQDSPLAKVDQAQSKAFVIQAKRDAQLQDLTLLKGNPGVPGIAGPPFSPSIASYTVMQDGSQQVQLLEGGQAINGCLLFVNGLVQSSEVYGVVGNAVQVLASGSLLIGDVLTMLYW